MTMPKNKSEPVTIAHS